ncbi:hypothetical protein H2198_009768 [Neophaeococcomyces mojaviensis]|uniref:Uncharacterized protein n=1 Tax=Neophaeococcomyces mojaviensis TaxID=3383035 RepID=A0ACC2ZTQ0_9EURO|nr:hypothetical protein H2198_009768 [Knufia sp. JES_112]
MTSGMWQHGLNNGSHSRQTSSTAVEDDSPTEPVTPISYTEDFDLPEISPITARVIDDQLLRDFLPGLHKDADLQMLKHSRHPSESPSSNTKEVDEERATLPQPAAVGFWHGALAQTRKDVARKYSGTLLILCVAVVGILSIYWGVLFDVKKNLHHATVAVVSFEGLPPYEAYTPIVGPFVRAAVEEEVASRPDHLGYEFRDPAEFDNDPMKVRLAVFNEQFWAAIIIHSNATALLRQAVEQGNTTYDPRGAGMMIYNQARDIESYNFYVFPDLSRLRFDITTSFASIWSGSVLTNNSLDAATYSQAPQAISPGISFTMLNLRPFDPPSAIPTITIGLIYLIIIAFFSFTFFIPTHMKFVTPNPTKPHPPLKFYQLVIYRWCATITAYFFLSLSYSLVSLAFRIPFSHTPPLDIAVDGHWPPTESVLNANYLGHATFFIYWLLNFIGMAALGLTCENMAMFLSALSPLPYSALFLIWWVITNVSTGFYAIELASDFYKWGYAWPLRHIVQGSKTLVFGTRSELGLNFGVLLAWVVVGTCLFPCACWVMRWKSMKDMKKAAEGQKGR